MATPKNKALNQKGMVSADFLFSMIIASVLCMVLFCVCFTFSVVEVAQYIAFSVSRAHAAGHVDISKQVQMAQNKFKVLSNSKAIGVLFKNGWFELRGPDIRSGGETGSTFGEYPAAPEDIRGVPQIGVRLQFIAKLLNVKFAFLGSTSEDDSDFSANVTGLLIREPTQQECQKQMQRDIRYKAILALDPNRFSLANGFANKYTAVEDSGC